MLHDAGLMRSECYVTNLVNARPYNNDLGQWFAFKKKDRTPAHVELMGRWVLPIVKEGYEALLQEIRTVQPRVIICLGNAAMWALTQRWGVVKWRGSMLRHNGICTIPTIHPAAILREWSWRQTTVQDFRRAKKIADGDTDEEPAWNFIIRPSFAKAVETLKFLFDGLETGDLEWLDFDLETRAGHIACAGISWTKLDAISLPFMCLENREGYWSLDEETEVLYLLYRVLTHPRVKVRWQNGLYDAQYTYKHWHFIPRGVQDTMISQHSIFATMPKSLAYQASIYAAFYTFWKEEGKLI